MDISKDLRDKTVEKEGRWFDLPEFGEGTRVKLRPWGNNDFLTFLQKKIRKHKRELDFTDLTQVDIILGKEVSNQAIARTILTDWDGFYDGKSKLDYSSELGELALEGREAFRDRIRVLAQQEEEFTTRVVEKLKVDLGRPSAGKSSGVAAASS